MAEDIFSRRCKELGLSNKKPSVQPQKPLKPEIFEQDRGVIASLLRGLRSGSTGVLLGSESQQQPQDETTMEHLASLGGELASDLPAYTGGAMLGGLLGPLGAGAGAFALPSLLKSSRRESEKLFQKPKDINLSTGLQALYNVGKETAKSGAVGLATGGASRLAPVIAKIPGISKLANTKLGRAAVGTGLEYGGLTGGQAAVEGELPSKQQLVDNALILGGFKLARVGAEKGRKAISKAKPIFEERYKKYKESQSKRAEYFDKLKDFVGKKDVESVETQFKWKRALDNAERSGKFSPKNREEMIYYRQKTGNPFIKGDTFEKLQSRLPESAKNFVDTAIDKHLGETLVDWNKTVAAQQIRPRAVLENTYLPGMYEYNPKGFLKAASLLKTKNPFANMKTFLTYNEAFKEAGLIPKHKDIISLVTNFDNLTNKLKANIKLVEDINEMQKDSGNNLVVRSNDSKAYREAEVNGYKQYWDPLLRQYKNPKSGKIELTAKPALVEPEFSSVFQGVFNKDPYKSDNFVLKNYDKASREIRSLLVQFSPFHYGALTESALGALGTKGVRFPTLMKEGRNLRTNEMFMRNAARSGLKLDSGIDDYRKGFSAIDRLLDKGLAKTEPGGIPSRMLTALSKAQGYLFSQFQPNIKAVTFNDLSSKYLTEAMKAKGKGLTIAEGLKINRDVAESVNNIYGGQQWETQRYFNDPQNQKKLRRFIGYADWTTSAIKQAALPFMGGVKGQIGRAYWLKYGLYMTAMHSAMKWLNSGFENDKETGRVNWNLDKANKEVLAGFTPGDPTSWYKIPLPDITFSIGGKNVNLGRDEKGKRLYMHGGKQALEIGRYLTNTRSAIFSKSNPLMRMSFKQIMGGTPWGERLFIEGGKYKYGEQKPWNATDPFTLSRYGERVKSITKDLVPFGVSNLINKGVAPWALSGFGTLPTSKGLNVFTATPYIEKAFINKDPKKLERVVSILEDNKIDPTSIKRRISLVKNSLKLDGKIKGLRLTELITTNAITKSIKDQDLNKLQKVVKSLKQNGYTQDKIDKRIVDIESKLKNKKPAIINVKNYIK